MPPYDVTINGVLYEDKPSGTVIDLGVLPVGTYTYNLTKVVDACGNQVPAASLPVTTSFQIFAKPTANAGAAASTCVTKAYTVSGASATNNNGVNWTHDGTGTLTNANLLTPTDTPGAGDAGKTVILTLHAPGFSTCAEVTSNKNLTVYAIPAADAGTAASTCVTKAYTSAAPVQVIIPESTDT